MPYGAVKAVRSEPVSEAAGQVVFRRPLLTVAAVVAADLLSLLFACLALFLVRRWADDALSAQLWMRCLLLIPLTLLALAVSGLYPALGLDVVEETKRVMICAAFVELGSLCGFWIIGGTHLERPMLAVSIAATVALPVGRSVVRALFARQSWWGEPVLLIGSGESLKTVFNLLNRHPRFGLRPNAVLHEAGSAAAFHGSASVPAFYDGEAGLRFAEQHQIRTAVVAMSARGGLSSFDLADRYGLHFARLIIVPPFSPRFNLCSIQGSLGSYMSLQITQRLMRRSARVTKRCLDLLIALPTAIVLAPLMLAIALIIKLDSPGPVFYAHRRIGKQNAPFRAWKFRTMVSDADTVLAERLATSPALRAEWDRNHKLRNDPRVTKVGAVLRKLSLDELPQLWNVLSSEMSVVGPRPICAAEVTKYAEYYSDYARVLPGITGLWQVSGRNETTYQERVEVDTYYINNWSPWLDLYIISRTLKAVVSTRGAY